MKIAIMQPYFIPYIGYWQLINKVDAFVVYDNIQYTKKGWFNRNYILINGEKKLFTIPLKKDSNYLNVNKRFLSADSEKAISRTVSQIRNSYKRAPYYKNVMPLVEKIFLDNERSNLFNYILFSIREIMDFLNISTRLIISSEVNINHSLKSEKKVLAITKALGATHYINPIGGIELYDKDRFLEEEIQLSFLESKIPQYSQFSYSFIPYLSIIDTMMFNSKSEINRMLNEYTLK